jgi:clusterin-associated protein 1
MVKLYDPETTISDSVEFENERIEFLTSIASLMAAKARIKLNTKKLYASDGKAVQELLKVANLLYRASKKSSKQTESEALPPPIKILDVKSARGLASEITRTGAKLFEMLEGEMKNRSERLAALRYLDSAATAHEGSREYTFFERSATELVETSKQQVHDLKKECEELDADERNIDSKIKKKQEELERTEKRLRSLENVRPQFMDEVEKLEKELQNYYDVYLEKYRNLDYLEHELAKYHRKEEERKEEQERRLKKMRERLLKEEVEILRGNRDDEGYESILSKSGGKMGHVNISDAASEVSSDGGFSGDEEMRGGRPAQRHKGDDRSDMDSQDFDEDDGSDVDDDDDDDDEEDDDNSDNDF